MPHLLFRESSVEREAWREVIACDDLRDFRRKSRYDEAMQLSPHFADTELGVSGAFPTIVANAMVLCNVLLEPLRAKFGPILITCGYRNPQHNAAVGGAPDSQHLYQGQNAAADFRPLAVDLTVAFDWIRLQSHLPFDQVILETDPGTQIPACIHISYNGALTKQRRMALTGETNGAEAYTAVQVNP
jgi:hypothetical protein